MAAPDPLELHAPAEAERGRLRAALAGCLPSVQWLASLPAPDRDHVTPAHGDRFDRGVGVKFEWVWEAREALAAARAALAGEE